MLREAWDRHAEEWIAWARTPGHDSYWQFHRDAFLPLVPSPRRLTLDAGCGEGRVGRDLATLGHRILGLDGSPTMARAASDHPESGGPCAIADAAQLPVGDATADLVVSFMALQDVDAMDDAVAEMARVLEPGGRLILAITHPASTTGRFAPPGTSRAGGSSSSGHGSTGPCCATRWRGVASP
ncbi:MAG: class I SAM-dependent methyltransferase [Acidimicrobiales bacterium]